MFFYFGWRRLRAAIVLLSGLLTLSSLPLAARSNPAPGFDAGYVYALAAADHLLQAWQAGDAEQGMVLLTGHAKHDSSTEAVEKFFSNSENAAYEIQLGKLVKRGRFEFPVVLVTSISTKAHVRRRFSSIVVVNTGGNDWAVDKLP